jgi:hypothetical protein
MAICTLEPAESKTPSIIVLKISVSPKKISRTRAVINAIRKKMIQIRLRAIAGIMG